MTSRDRVLRTLNHQAVDRAPRDLWVLPGMENERADDLAELTVRFPPDILQIELKPPQGKRSKAANRAGHVTDVWGCTWDTDSKGQTSALVESPLADPAPIATYEPPAELLEGARFAQAGKAYDDTSRFVLAWSETRLLDRLQFLRGPETALAELSSGNKEIRGLLARLHDFSRREMQLWACTHVDGVAFRDALGTPTSLRVTPKVWRQLFKPLYREYCEILHAADKFALFHCDGQISEIFGDLVEIGVDAIHSQFFLTDFEKLAAKYRGRVTFWGDIGQERIAPPACPAGIRETVRRVRKALDYNCGGVIAQCPWAPGTPLRHLAAFFEEWMAPIPLKG